MARSAAFAVQARFKTRWPKIVRTCCGNSRLGGRQDLGIRGKGKWISSAYRRFGEEFRGPEEDEALCREDKAGSCALLMKRHGYLNLGYSLFCDDPGWSQCGLSREAIAERTHRLHKIAATRSPVKVPSVEQIIGKGIPYCWFSAKARCFAGCAADGGTCQKAGHHCLRRVNGARTHPARRWTRSRTRALT